MHNSCGCQVPLHTVHLWCVYSIELSLKLFLSSVYGANICPASGVYCGIVVLLLVAWLYNFFFNFTMLSVPQASILG
jgi:hypothetical protein